jgi:hypothetical protein
MIELELVPVTLGRRPGRVTNAVLRAGLCGGLAIASAGCSITGGAQGSRMLHHGTDFNPSERGTALGFAYGGRAHSTKYKPLMAGIEGYVGKEVDEGIEPDTTLRRSTALIGVSKLPLAGGRIGYEGAFTITIGSVPVNDNVFTTFGAGLRGAPVFRLWTPFSEPCEDAPYAATSLLFVPELGFTTYVPRGDDARIQTEGQLVLSFWMHGWSSLIDL